MGILWKRRIEVTLGDRKYEYPPWGIKFNVGFDISSQLQTAEVTLFNLSWDTVDSIERGMGVKIKAGHEEATVEQIFLGVVDKHKTVRRPPDKITVIKCQEDRDKALNVRVPGKSWEPGVKAEQVIRDLFETGGIAVGLIQDGGLVYEKGKTFDPSFTVGKALDQVLADVEAHTEDDYEWHLVMGKGYFVHRKTHIGVVVKVSPETGLIGTPEETEEDVPSKGGAAVKKQYAVQTVLNPKIVPGCKIEITSKRVNGAFKVMKGRHVGSPDGEFRTEMVVEEIEEDEEG